MTSPLGYVVLARRPNPYKQDPWDYWTVGSKTFLSPGYAADALADGSLKGDLEVEALEWKIDQDSQPNHRHHRECIHNLPGLTQIEMRGKTMSWWQKYVGERLPEQITYEQWETEPKPDPVEYVIGEIRLCEPQTKTRFGLEPDTDADAQLGAALERINEAERQAWNNLT